MPLAGLTRRLGEQGLLTPQQRTLLLKQAFRMGLDLKKPEEGLHQYSTEVLKREDLFVLLRQLRNFKVALQIHPVEGHSVNQEELGTLKHHLEGQSGHLAHLLQLDSPGHLEQRKGLLIHTADLSVCLPLPAKFPQAAFREEDSDLFQGHSVLQQGASIQLLLETLEELGDSRLVTALDLTPVV